LREEITGTNWGGSSAAVPFCNQGLEEHVRKAIIDVNGRQREPNTLEKGKKGRDMIRTHVPGSAERGKCHQAENRGKELSENVPKYPLKKSALTGTASKVW